MNSWQRFSPLNKLSVFSSDYFFAVQKPSSLMQSQLSDLALISWATEVLFRKSLPMPRSSSIFPMICDSSFKVLGLNSRSLIYFELILIHGERQRSSFHLLCVKIQFSQHHLLKSLSFSNLWFWHLGQNLADCYCVGLFLGLLFYSIGQHVPWLLQEWNIKWNIERAQ
jgi:hypothetical protein